MDWDFCKGEFGISNFKLELMLDGGKTLFTGDLAQFYANSLDFGATGTAIAFTTRSVFGFWFFVFFFSYLWGDIFIFFLLFHRLPASL